MQINVASIKNKPFKCTLDEILKPTTTQKQVFYLVGQPMILSSLEGFNSTIFAYGQSGSGKTYTVKLFFIDHSLSNILITMITMITTTTMNRCLAQKTHPMLMNLD